DHAVRGETVGLLPLLRLGDRARTPVTVHILDADGLLGTLDGLALGVELDQRGLAGDLLVAVATTGRAADLDVARLDAAEHLGEVLRGRLAAGPGTNPGERDVDMVRVGGHGVVSAPARGRVAGGTHRQDPDERRDAELLGEGDEGVGQGGAVACAVGADAEVGRATLTVEGSGATAANRPAIVDAGVHATLGLVGGQKVVHCAPRAGLGAGGAGT